MWVHAAFRSVENAKRIDDLFIVLGSRNLLLDLAHFEREDRVANTVLAVHDIEENIRRIL